MKKMLYFIILLYCFLFITCSRDGGQLNNENNGLQLNTINEGLPFNILYDVLFYDSCDDDYNIVEYYEINLNKKDLEQLNIILQKDTWELDDDPLALSFLYGGYGLKYKDKAVVYFNYFEHEYYKGKTIIIIKNPDNGYTTTVYIASDKILKDIDIFFKNNFK